MSRHAPKPLTSVEVKMTAEHLRRWTGAQLQEVIVEGVKGESPLSLRLGFYGGGMMLWLVCDYTVQAPQLILFGEESDGPTIKRVTKVSKVRRPIELFLRSKIVGRRLRDARHELMNGRVLTLVFDRGESGEDAEIEFRLYPHGRNAIARFGTASISEFKPSETAAVVDGREGADQTRDVRTLREEWMAGVFGEVASRDDRLSKTTTTLTAPAAPSAPSVAPLKENKTLTKKRVALEKVRAEIAMRETSPHGKIGEYIKAAQSLDVPREWREFIDPDQSLAKNIERLFTEAKTNARKIAGTRARAKVLEAEIAKLETLNSEDALSGRSKSGLRRASAFQVKPPGADLLHQAGARGRTFTVADDLLLFIGKNANENLSILRKAQPFDLWMHLRERPGAHAILRRTRGRKVTDEELRKAGVFVAEQTMKRRANELKGEAFDLLVVECRYVRPIKGDKLGRVHYTNDRVLRLKF